MPGWGFRSARSCTAAFAFTALAFSIFCFGIGTAPAFRVFNFGIGTAFAFTTLAFSVFNRQ
jgi:hypothetical protein